MARPRKSDQLADVTDLACDDRVVHAEAVRSSPAAWPAGSTLAGLAEIFAVMGDPTRLRIVAALAVRELCVRDLVATAGQSESAVSHQLRLPRTRGLVRSRRDGRLVDYARDDDHVAALYRRALDHVSHGRGENR